MYKFHVIEHKNGGCDLPFFSARMTPDDLLGHVTVRG